LALLNPGYDRSGASTLAAYEAKIRWQRRPNERFVDGRYSRAHEWLFDGGAQVHASSSPHVVRLPFSDPSGVDPEEAFVAAIASCHMLFFLAFAAKRGFEIATYEDGAVGVIGVTDNGPEWMTKVTLRPRVEFTGDKRPTAGDLEALHHESHAACYIANSIKTEVVVEGLAEGLR
jgi:organic hydroperoxide reductase OsmC/OhrA